MIQNVVIMKNLLLLSMLSLVLMACLKPKDETVSPESDINIPELGEYNSFTILGGQLSYQYSVVTNTWEWKYGLGFQILPSPFGRLSIKSGGRYEFLDLKESGTFSQNKTTKKLEFKGYLSGAEGYYAIQKGTCILILSTKDKDGKINSIQFEKKSAYIQPDIKNPNASFKGTIINRLAKNSTDYIDIASGKSIKTHSSYGFPITGLSVLSIDIYKNNYLDDGEIYPNLDILDASGNVLYKYKGQSKSGKKWAIGNYWYGMPSPDGSKIVLTGLYTLHNSLFDPNYVAPYTFVSVIDTKTGEEIATFDSDKQNNWGAGWTPNGELVMPRKGGGISLVDAQLKTVKTIYTKVVKEARINQNGKVLFAEGSTIFTMDSNGSNILPVKNGSENLTSNLLQDSGWSPDGKSIAVVYKVDFLPHNYIIFVDDVTKNASFLNDSKGDRMELSSPFLNWK
jgi:hypothetical protein